MNVLPARVSNPLFVAIFSLSASSVHATCKNWGDAREIGQLNHGEIHEASGLAVSRAVPGRLYHVNDAGSTAHFYTTDQNGGRERRVALSNHTAVDTEDLSLGSCGQGGGSCLFIADIGDNDLERRDITIVLVREKDAYKSVESPLRTIKLRYPDGAHNAEGFAVHPNGDMFIVTKGKDTTFYKLSADQWQAESARDSFELERVTAFDVESLSSGSGKKSVVTSFDISADGGSFLLLTSSEVFEVALDLSTLSNHQEIDARQLQRTGVLRRIEVENLKQQEAVAYAADLRSFIYTTESKKKDAPVMQVMCGR